jgi:hypothetical protein
MPAQAASSTNLPRGAPRPLQCGHAYGARPRCRSSAGAGEQSVTRVDARQCRGQRLPQLGPSAANNWRSSPSRRASASSGLEEQDRHLPHVQIDEVLRLVRDVAAKVAADDAVPRGAVLLVKLLLDVCKPTKRSQVRRQSGVAASAARRSARRGYVRRAPAHTVCVRAQAAAQPQRPRRRQDRPMSHQAKRASAAAL